MLRRRNRLIAESAVPLPAAPSSPEDRELATQEIAIVESTTDRTS
jgi:hypothetical protein